MEPTFRTNFIHRLVTTGIQMECWPKDEQEHKQRRAQAALRIPLELRAQFVTVGEAIPKLWPTLPASSRKALLRCLVDKVVLRRLPDAERVLLRIVWRGGAFTDKELEVTTPRKRSQKEHQDE